VDTDTVAQIHRAINFIMWISACAVGRIIYFVRVRSPGASATQRRTLGLNALRAAASHQNYETKPIFFGNARKMSDLADQQPAANVNPASN
jgi:hypothetical protein